MGNRALWQNIFLNGTVGDHWRRLADDDPDREAIVHWVAGEEPFRWKRGSLLAAAAREASFLKEAGVRKGDVCALIIRHRVDFYPVYMAVSGIGAIPAVLAYPNSRIHPDKFREGLEGMSRRSGLEWVLTERDLEPVLRPILSRDGSTIRGILYPLDRRQDESSGRPDPPPDVPPESPCLLQHSSGTTGLQKAVMLSHRAVLEHVRRYGESIGISSEDKVVSWLPLYHDMGLIAAFYLPLVSGVPVVQLDPFEWVSAPVILLEAVSRERGTLAWLPNFAYNLLADRVREDDLEGIRLDSVRMLVNCSEPVRSDSHDRFHRRFEPRGFRREALGASYAMAETTFAATQTPPGAEASRLLLDGDMVSKGIVREAGEGANVRVCVSSGIPISGCDLRILADAGEDLPDGRIGEIAIRSVSMFDGYRNDREKTAEVLKDGWYHSGDYGFRHEGQYYVIGRKKDLMIVAGRNIYPEDVEDAVGRVEGVIPGRVIAFGIEDAESGTEQVCVVAETSTVAESERKRLRLKIREAGIGIDVTISRAYLAPPRWLIKSSAGKPSRGANRDRALAELAHK